MSSTLPASLSVASTVVLLRALESRGMLDSPDGRIAGATTEEPGPDWQRHDHRGRLLLPGMIERGWGRVINVSSVAGKIGLKYGSAYAASKHGLIGLTRSLALEGARKGVTANAICPSWTETQMMDDAVEQVALHTQRTEAEARKAILRGNPTGGAALPEEVADVAVLLAASPIVTGQSIHVDGGEVMA